MTPSTSPRRRPRGIVSRLTRGITIAFLDYTRGRILAEIATLREHLEAAEESVRQAGPYAPDSLHAEIAHMRRQEDALAEELGYCEARADLLREADACEPCATLAAAAA